MFSYHETQRRSFQNKEKGGQSRPSTSQHSSVHLFRFSIGLHAALVGHGCHLVDLQGTVLLARHDLDMLAFVTLQRVLIGDLHYFMVLIIDENQRFTGGNTFLRASHMS